MVATKNEKKKIISSWRAGVGVLVGESSGMRGEAPGTRQPAKIISTLIKSLQCADATFCQIDSFECQVIQVSLGSLPGAVNGADSS